MFEVLEATTPKDLEYSYLLYYGMLACSKFHRPFPTHRYDLTMIVAPREPNWKFALAQMDGCLRTSLP